MNILRKSEIIEITWLNSRARKTLEHIDRYLLYISINYLEQVEDIH